MFIGGTKGRLDHNSKEITTLMQSIQINDVNLLTGLIVGLTLGFILGVTVTKLRFPTSSSVNGTVESSDPSDAQPEDVRILAENVVLKLAWDHPNVKDLPESLLYDDLTDRALMESGLCRDVDSEDRDQIYLTSSQKETFVANFELAVLIKMYNS